MENVKKKFNDIPSYIKWNDDVDNPRFIVGSSATPSRKKLRSSKAGRSSDKRIHQ